MEDVNSIKKDAFKSLLYLYVLAPRMLSSSLLRNIDNLEQMEVHRSDHKEVKNSLYPIKV